MSSLCVKTGANKRAKQVQQTNPKEQSFSAPSQEEEEVKNFYRISELVIKS